MSNKDSVTKTVSVALILCIVCSVIVSTAAVILKPAQVANKAKDFNRNILQAAGLYVPGKSVEEQFSQISTRLVDLNTGRFTEEFDASKYDQWKAAKDPSLSTELSDEDDLAKISRRENVSAVYFVESDKGVEKVILPIRGYGLWSTLYGFMALDSDFNTVVGLGFYNHGETPGLGGEVDNPKWKSLWEDKEVYNSEGNVVLHVIKGQAPEGDVHKVDGLSGATLTSKGVDNLVHFWLGNNGFKRFLENLKKGEA